MSCLFDVFWGYPNYPIRKWYILTRLHNSRKRFCILQEDTWLMDSFNLRNLFLEVWNLFQMYHLWVAWRNVKQTAHLKKTSNFGGCTGILLITVKHMGSCKLQNFGGSLCQFCAIRLFSFSVYLSIYLSIYPSIYLSFHLSTHLSIRLFMSEIKIN